jgi:deoxyribodipyrimidine photolyase
VQVAAAVGASAVFCNRRYEPAMAAGDAAVAESLAAAGLQLQSYSGLLLQEPWEVQVSCLHGLNYVHTLLHCYIVTLWHGCRPAAAEL